MNLKDRAAQLTEALAIHGTAKKASAALGMSTSSFTSFAYQCRRAGHDVPRILPPRLCSTKEFRALWDQGLSKREIATKLGVSLARVCDFVVNHHAELGIDPKDRYLVKPLVERVTHEEYKKAVEGSRSCREIADKLSLNLAQVYALRSQKGDLTPLKVDKVQDLLDVWQTCKSIAEVCQKTGLQPSSVMSIASRYRRKGYPFKHMSGKGAA